MEEEYIWITKYGTHIKIKKNQSPMDAFIRQNGNKNNLKQEKIKKDILKVKLDYKEVEKYLKSKKYENEIKEFIINKQDNSIKSCHKVADKVTKFLNDNGIEAETIRVTAIARGETETPETHSVTKMNNKLYDFTGKQFLDGQDSNDVELRIYKNVFANYYAEDNININKNLSNLEKRNKIIEYTKNNLNKIILVKSEKNYPKNLFSNVLSKL